MSYSNYDTAKKANSTMKRTMNTFISSYVDKDSTAVVLDAETLLSSTTLVQHGAQPKNIVVINTEGDIINKAREKGHVFSIQGISTNVLPRLSGTYDIIYLDYCGTPEIHQDGFNPAFDLLWAADRVKDNGIIVTTFSRRTKDAIEKANDLIPFTLTLAKEVNYCETVPMYSMIMTKVNPREASNRFNHLKRSLNPIAPKEPAPVPVTPKKRRSKRTPQPRIQMNIQNLGGKQYFGIEKILRRFKKGRGIFFEVKWFGYKQTTVEPRKILLDDVPTLVRQYEQRL